MKNVHKVSTTVLENGIKLVHVYIPNFPVAVSSFWSKVGSRNDPKGKEGMAHFFEHLLLTKTSNIPDRQKRLVEVEKRGFLFNAFTSLETSHYYYVHSNESIKEALDLLVDGYSSSIFDKKDIEEEKQIIIDEERRNRNDPQSYIWRLANSALWPNSQMGSDFFGNPESLEKINEENIKGFYSQYYQSENTTFVLINSNKDIKENAKKIESLKKSGKPLTNSSNLGEKLGIVFDKREIDYSVLALSFITCDGDNYRDCLVLDFIKNYLAGGWISRLILRLRIENKLTYWVNSNSDNLSDTGYLRFTASVDNNKIIEVLKIFEEEIISLKTSKIGDEIIKQHKNKYKGELMRNCLSTNFLNLWYGSDTAIFGHTLPSIQQYIKDMENISSDEIKTVANKYLNSQNFSIAVIGKDKFTDTIPTFQ